MGEKRGTKALELWCRRITEGYSGVHVHNMTTSWKDGLAFCAMIHHFRPDLIDFDSLDKNDVYGNNELAFKTAEQHLGIPALLDAEDMASCSVPDRLSILTYLSQFYQTFSGSSPSRLSMNSRTTVNVDDRITEVSKSSKKEVETRLGMRRDPCAACGLPVFLAEKFMIAHVTYHRTCFRCARCNSQLTLGNYYETEESQYCCETCPDEESSLSATHENYSEAVLQSDLFRDAEIENTIIDCKGSPNSDGSTERRILNHSAAKIMDLQDSSIPDLIAQTSQLRLNSISNHILSRKGEEILVDNSLVDLDLSQHRNDSAVKSNTEGTNKITAAISKNVYTKPKGECNLSTDSLKLSFHSKSEAVESVSENFVKMVDHMHNISSDSKGDVKHKLLVSSFPGMTKDKPITSVTGMNNAEEALDHTECNDTKNCMSIVQKQLKVFETEGTKNHSEETDNNHRGVRVLESKTYVKEQLAMIEDLKKVIVHPDFLNISSKSYVDASSFTANQINLEKSDSLEVKETSLNQEGRESAEKNDLNKNDDYPKDLNPFKSDEEENDFDKCRVTADSPRNPMEEMKPFETREVEKLQVEGIVSPKPGVRCVNNNKPNQPLLMETSAKRRLPAPQVSLNPFWTDEDDSSSDLECTEETLENTPVPKPRLLKYHQETEKNGRMSDLSRCVLHEPNSFLYTGAGTSIGGTYRKKKAAPPPPNIKELCYIEQYKPFEFKSQDDSTEYHDTPSRTASKTRKTKPAPPPPMLIRTPCKTTKSAASNYEKSLIDESYVMTRNSNMWEDNKTNTDEENKNRKSLSRFPFERNSDYKVHPDKSTQGKWKRKKGPAPSLPTPHRRKVKVRSFEDVNMELDEIELQQQGLEKQGVRLEQLIRNKCESGSVNDDTSLGTDVEELLLELFALVNEKNELFRRQAELMLLRRQQRLEEEHIEVEYQIRCLLSKHEAAKTDFDKQTEEVLIQRLVEIVERRNEIVECLEMDRRREMEEDRSILRHMDLFTASYKSAISRNNMDDHHSAKMKKSKTKEKKFKKIFKKDFEKDIDETELKSKCHNKRKWYYLPSITNS